MNRTLDARSGSHDWILTWIVFVVGHRANSSRIRRRSYSEKSIESGRVGRGPTPIVNMVYHFVCVVLRLIRCSITLILGLGQPTKRQETPGNCLGEWEVSIRESALSDSLMNSTWFPHSQSVN